MTSSQNLFEALFDAAVEAVIVIDEKGLMQTVNKATEKLFGYSTSQLTGRNVSMLMPEPMASEHDSYIEHYQRTAEPQIIGIGREVVCRKRNGILFPADLAVGEGVNEGKPFFVGILRDLTERKRLQDSLARREAELRVILDHSPLATAVIDSDGRFIQVNPACLELTGYSRAEMRSTPLQRLAVDSEQERLAQQLAAVLSGRPASITHRCVRKDGGQRTGTLYMTSLPHSEDGPERVLVQFVDETDRVAAERQKRKDRETLAEVSRLSVLGEMAAGIAHEVNQPLGAISNYAEACRIRLGDTVDEKTSELLTKISGQAQRAGEVIRRLRSAADGQSSEARVLDTNDLVKGVIELAGLDARFVGVAVTTDLAPEVAAARANEVGVQQVLFNLLRNAVEATADAGGDGVVVKTCNAPGGVTISVVDSGPGISDEIAGRIMQPFFTTKQSGMGVGLALSQSLVEASRGRLWFENNETDGATFHVLLPAASEDADNE